ncbi:MAG: hypothetical protein R3C05_22355 [Pirellulaceae bacterium]
MWDAITGAETLYVSVVKDNENFDEVWYTDPNLAGSATSVTSDELPTGESLIAAVQANFRRDDLASATSDDGTVSVAFYVNAISGNEFSIAEPTAEVEPFAEFEFALEQAHFPDGSVATFAFMDVELINDDLWTSDMQIHIQQPGGSFQVQPTGWTAIAVDF